MRMRTRAARTLLVLAVAALPVMAGCAKGPSTKQELCTAFNELGAQVMQGNGIIGNPLFHKSDEVGDIAGRYPGANLSTDAAALKKIADSSSTSALELGAATHGIARVCGHLLSYLFG